MKLIIIMSKESTVRLFVLCTYVQKRLSKNRIHFTKHEMTCFSILASFTLLSHPFLFIDSRGCRIFTHPSSSPFFIDFKRV